MLFQGGFDYKKAIVDTIITIIEENTEAKEAGTFTIIFPSLSLLSLRRAIFWLTTKSRVTATIFFLLYRIGPSVWVHWRLWTYSPCHQNPASPRTGRTSQPEPIQIHPLHLQQSHPRECCSQSWLEISCCLLITQDCIVKCISRYVLCATKIRVTCYVLKIWSFIWKSHISTAHIHQET